MYAMYEMQSALLAPGRMLARLAEPLHALGGENPGAHLIRYFGAACQVASRIRLTHTRPPFAIDHVKVKGKDGDKVVPVIEETVGSTPFGTLLRFRRTDEGVRPRVLIVAPLSGHFATLLRGTVATMVADHDVYITDWHNARDIPKAAGKFGFDEYVTHVIGFLEQIGPGAHVLAVCQPCVQVIVAAAVMAEENNPAQPRSITLMGGPVDTRINPTQVNELASGKPIEWFEKKLISTVPLWFKGAGRKVYPGFVQLTAFMSMNVERHVKAHQDLYQLLAQGKEKEATAIEAFYDEYFAVLDLTAEFYLETLVKVFQNAQLAKGELTYQGKLVKPSLIKRTALLTVEGERDDICAPGQTLAAHDMCTGLRPYMKRHHLQAGVGHYGLFNGHRWDNRIYPIVQNFILSMN